jgi:DNA oxidative demethylase
MAARQLSFEAQLDLGVPEDGRPDGLRYEPEFITPDEEAQLLSFAESLDLRPVTMRGQESKRMVRHFGYAYEYESAGVAPGDPIPAELAWLRDRTASLAEIDPTRVVQAMVSRYPEGAGIGWHRDAPKFGSKVMGVSLLSACRMRFQRRLKDRRDVFALELEPRSAYVLGGSARASWQHSIPATKALRYSITFRMVRDV